MSTLIEHTPKLWERTRSGIYSYWMIYCPGCKCCHGFHTGAADPPNWTFNGNLQAPTFTPSLMCNAAFPTSRCHLNLTDGRIQFHDDCHHELRGKLVDMEEI